MAKHGVKLITLRDCFEFLHWLHKNSGVRDQVARELMTRYENSYNHISFTGQLPRAVSEFLGYVSTFYKKLVATPIKESYIDPKAKDVTEAILDCIPKFLAALYFLLYNVDYRFEAVGGAKWQDDYPGWELDRRDFWGRTGWGGELQRYLRMSLSVKYGDLIAGGFSENEVTYGYEYDSRYGYQYGKDMIPDLKNILDKHSHKYNDFRDVFFTTVISKSGLQKSNTANVLALVKTFCEIVQQNPDGGSLKAVLEKELEGKCVNWSNLVAHCKTLEQQLGKLFNIEGFSFTGQARRVDELNTERFAGETAIWFRQHLHEVQKNVEQIDTNFPVDDTLHLNVLQQFATENLFPYGFIFGDQSYGTLGDAWKKLSDHWPSVIGMLGRDGDGLDKLKRILDGEECRTPAPPPKPRSRPAPAPRPPRPARPATPPVTIHSAPKEVVPEKKVPVVPPKKPEPPPQKSEGTPNQGKKSEGAQNQGKKSEGAQNQGKKSEGAQNQGKKSEGAQNQGKKSEGAQNQGKKSEGAQNQGKKSEGAQNQGKTSHGTPNHNNGQSGDTSATSPVVKSVVSAPAPGGHGASGPPGPKGDKGNTGPQGPLAAVTPGSSSTAVRTDQQPVQIPNQPLPHAPPVPPPLPGGPGPAAPQAPTLTQPPSVPGPGTGSSVSGGGESMTDPDSDKALGANGSGYSGYGSGIDVCM
ncbi:ribosome binding protein, putative [Babesia ovata]|uniref:Ribosome binding protein, putative n=1 Tax=Babesia ovata TaxID=189622 RepID=A0A2H6KG26_9APIC|nr:ribosome binding protein, putative [Babesia ovata]GBE61945.1 ribosome binding protein, putative [Babesia ovata]